MWVARFRLKDDADIYAPACESTGVTFQALPLSYYKQAGTLHTIVAGSVAGDAPRVRAFITAVRRDQRVRTVEQHHDFLVIHAVHPATREAKAELAIFYDPRFIHVKPVAIDAQGWEDWEVACAERPALVRLVSASKRYYHGTLISLREEKLRNVAALSLANPLTPKQMAALREAYAAGYYQYPRKRTIPDLARQAKKSYSTFQEHLRKAENKLISYFMKYR